ncbi:hypothetical protein C8035_v001937 [Colletotrichum spinosum]|uniref:Uncharacterized protein n=1 Tax=Colletotrichum spinosum TaxID=1347390 RepID=A0A4R8PZK0_9PEZI|nr:hypothetical protein C8035_v001937 [Colletotrichum spinosum]
MHRGRMRLDEHRATSTDPFLNDMPCLLHPSQDHPLQISSPRPRRCCCRCSSFTVPPPPTFRVLRKKVVSHWQRPSCMSRRPARQNTSHFAWSR